ncbi:MAG: sulfatase-like hydrolase/transferase [Proteobacteria bacterium]|nr:sulfatase-like hydrolase/transferase [Pseudomonadota bacterium]
MTDYRRTAAALLALLFLNGSLSFRNWWPTPGILPDARLAPGFVWLWLLLLLVVAWRGALSRRAAGLLAAVYSLLVLLRYADVTAPALFGRAVNLYWDVPRIPRFVWVAVQGGAWWQVTVALTALALLGWGLHRLLRVSIEVVAREAVPYALRARWTWLATAVALVLVLANHAGVRATWPLVSKPVLPSYWGQFDLLASAASSQRIARALPATTVVDGALASANSRALEGLQGRDVYLVFLESVGAVVYDDERAVRLLGPARERLAGDIAAAGLQVVSAFVRSPTIGGGSDLAHVSLLAGMDLADPRRHDLLLTTTRPSLISVFRSHGYQTFGLYSSVFWDWPERAWYGYDVYVEGRTLDYRGPTLGNWWRVPDQFAFARFEQLYPRVPPAPPRFVFAATINTHVPFGPVPPYQPDWQRLLGEWPFDDADAARALAVPVDWLDMTPAYLRLVEYTYRWIGGYLRLPPSRDTVYVLLGDHQPTANVSGEGASWDVPVHIISRDPQLLERFVAQGFVAGLEPPRTPLGGMHELTAMLLQAFGPVAPH